MENIIYTDIMVDIETTGTQPDRNAILQISAVKFNLEAKQVCPVFFDRCLTMPKWRHWDQATAQWWSRQKPSVLKDILVRQEPWQGVIKDFHDFGLQSPGLRFWAKPTTFDFMFCASYFADADLDNPYSFRDAKDLNSFLYGLHYPQPIPDIPWSAGGDAHNALSDTLNQLKWLFDHMAYKEGTYVSQA